jgi:hypothetical protein
MRLGISGLSTLAGRTELVVATTAGAGFAAGTSVGGTRVGSIGARAGEGCLAEVDSVFIAAVAARVVVGVGRAGAAARAGSEGPAVDATAASDSLFVGGCVVSNENLSGSCENVLPLVAGGDAASGTFRTVAGDKPFPASLDFMCGAVTASAICDS